MRKVPPGMPTGVILGTTNEVMPCGPTVFDTWPAHIGGARLSPCRILIVDVPYLSRCLSLSVLLCLLFVGVTPGAAMAGETGELRVIGGGFHFSVLEHAFPTLSTAFEMGAGQHAGSGYYLVTFGHQISGISLCAEDGGCYLGFTIFDVGIDGGLFVSQGNHVFTLAPTATAGLALWFSSVLLAPSAGVSISLSAHRTGKPSIRLVWEPKARFLIEFGRSRAFVEPVFEFQFLVQAAVF